MTKIIKLELADEQIKDAETVAFRLAAKLVEGGESVEDQFRIPQVRFEIRLQTGQVIAGESDLNGIFTTDEIELKNPTESQLDAEVEADDGVGKISGAIKLDIASLMTRYGDYKRGFEQAKAIAKKQAEEARKEDAERRSRETREDEESRKREEAKRDAKARSISPDEMRAIEKNVLYAASHLKEGTFSNGHPGNLLEVLAKYAELPVTKRAVCQVSPDTPNAPNAQYVSRGIIMVFSTYKKASWARDLVEKAMRVQPEYFIENLTLFVEEKWLPDLLMILAKSHPHLLINLDHLFKFKYQQWAFKVLMIIAEANPQGIVDLHEEYEEFKWGKELYEFAVEKITEAGKLRQLEDAKRFEKARRVEEIWNIKKQELLKVLKSRFEIHTERHQSRGETIRWDRVKVALEANEEALSSIYKMEQAGHHPDVYFADREGFDVGTCSKESPESGRNCVYDDEGEKENKTRRLKVFNGNATKMAADFGVEIMSGGQYKHLQRLGEYDMHSSSWLRSPTNSGDQINYGYRASPRANPYAMHPYIIMTTFSHHNQYSRSWRGTIRVNWAD